MKQESLLWKSVKKGLTRFFLTRIESSTINGIPDIHAVNRTGIFWIELKSDELSFPKLKETPSKATIKLYRPVSSFTDPRSLKPVASFSSRGQWPRIQEQLEKELVLRQLGS
jgi:hypothetical protein